MEVLHSIFILDFRFWTIVDIVMNIALILLHTYIVQNVSLEI